ncbi:MAG: rod shape-determining protein RodA [Desulfobacteraceae bacterium]
MFDRRLVECFDWGLFFITCLISCIGLAVLYSAVTAGAPGGLHILFKKQIIWIGFGFVVMCASFTINYKLFDKGSLAIYLVCIGLLGAVLVFGKNIGGSQRWLDFGFFTMQPSELMKVSLIISLSAFYSVYAREEGLNFLELLKPGIILFIPFSLIVVQPDLGTSLLLFFIAAAMTLFVKVEKRVLYLCTGVTAIAAPLVWFVLKDYQKARLLTFLNPERDPLGAGYHIIQSKIAIGSGMVFGKGFLQGTQNALSFLPEQHTDFILSVLAEEWGLAGCAVLLILYFILLLCGLNVSYCCRDKFGSVLAFGITTMIFWQVFINVGMVMGLLPVVGVPLPLVSYGGSSVLTNMVGIGILLNISMRNFS